MVEARAAHVSIPSPAIDAETDTLLAEQEGKTLIMAAWEYKVAYIDYRGRISSEGQETLIGSEERRSTFARRYMDALGHDGWELVGIQPLSPQSAYYIFKRPATEGHPSEESASSAASAGPTQVEQA